VGGGYPFGTNARLKVPFVPGSGYTLVRAGTTLDTHPEDAWNAGALTEAHLWHYQNTDAFATRTGDRGTTLYAVAICYNGVLIRPQFKYLQMCYRQRKRDATKMHSILDDGTPWWTDSYLANQLESIRAKERYKVNKKQKHA
jgi:hypothetical protein